MRADELSAILVRISGQPMGSLLPAAIGAGAGVVAKNLLYAVMPRKPQLEAWDGAAFVSMVGRSNRSRVMTLSHAATKSRTNFGRPSSEP